MKADKKSMEEIQIETLTQILLRIASLETILLEKNVITVNELSKVQKESLSKFEENLKKINKDVENIKPELDS
jgi:hypothetical protein